MKGLFCALWSVGNHYHIMPKINQEIVVCRGGWSICASCCFIKPGGFRVSHACFQIPGHTSAFINEPKLSDFKTVLLREGIQAEFVAGVLICNNQVAVRRVRIC